MDDEALDIVQRTRTTNATYAVYLWGEALDDEGESQGGSWTAEFHLGDWHRMDGSNARVVANCRTHVGFYHDVASGETTDAPNAYRGACGIYDAPDITAAERLPNINNSFGSLDVVKLTDDKFQRFYAVDVRGVIVESDWIAKDGSPAPCITTRAVAVSSTLPESDIFTAASLDRSVVPDKYRRQPPGIRTPGLSGKICGKA